MSPYIIINNIDRYSLSFWNLSNAETKSKMLNNIYFTKLEFIKLIFLFVLTFGFPAPPPPPWKRLNPPPLPRQNFCLPPWPPRPPPPLPSGCLKIESSIIFRIDSEFRFSVGRWLFLFLYCFENFAAHMKNG